jgi:hypothetical protein
MGLSADENGKIVGDKYPNNGFDGSIFEMRYKYKVRGDKFGIFITKTYQREISEKASLTIDKAKELLEYCSSLGLTTTFLYILGLEDLETIEHYFNYLKGSINKFPIIQVFQNYTPYQEMYRCEEAKDVEFYIKARMIIDDIFKNKEEMKPKTWECFRSLYFDDKEKSGGKVRCKKMY